VLRFDADSAECLVFTYRDGLLAAVAHDLKIRVTRFTIEAEEKTRSIHGIFDAASLRVVSAMRAGEELPHELSSQNRAQIEANIARDVLDPQAHPEIRFVSAAVDEVKHGYRLRGDLTICGRQRRITLRVRRDDSFYIAEARVRQPDFGIRPYSAMLGTLKVKPDVLVQVRVPIPG
jgi:hypothetical protein